MNPRRAKAEGNPIPGEKPKRGRPQRPAPHRMICRDIFVGESAERMGRLGCLAFLAVLLHADDEGRCLYNTGQLRAKLGVSVSLTFAKRHISEGLTLAHNSGNIWIYEVQGVKYIQVLNWNKYQKLRYVCPSKYPEPTLETTKEFSP